jgi:hypothetical protein
MIQLLKRKFNHWYYRRLFFHIYFLYLKHSNNPDNAINDALDDVMAIKDSLNEKLSY